jgi:Xaa-Pro aminopeptidase
MAKTPEEIRRLKRACEITVRAHESFRDAIRVGATDRDLFRAAARRMFDEGADGIHFINVGAGPVGYAAHAPYPVDYTLKRGDFAKVDMGALVEGYPADFVRSYYLGEASQRQRDIWRWLNDAQLEVGARLKPGMTGGEIFELGYGLISRHLENFPREFVAHGLGLGTHEQPRCNRVNRSVLEPNAVICVEYSYYSQGVRFHTEDTFLVKDDGVEHWTADCPRELIVPA